MLKNIKLPVIWDAFYDSFGDGMNKLLNKQLIYKRRNQTFVGVKLP